MYKVIIEKRVLKDIENIPKDSFVKILNVIEELACNPYPPNIKKLKGREAWRIRVGNYRIIYQINNDELKILIIKIGHRKDIYD